MWDTANIPKIGMLSCLTYKDEESEQYISHCLSLDVMEFGKTPDEAWKNLKTSIKHYIEYCFASYRKGFASSASRKDWHRFGEILKVSGKFKVEEIDLALHSPLPESGYPLWMQEVSSNNASNYFQ